MLAGVNKAQALSDSLLFSDSFLLGGTVVDKTRKFRVKSATVVELMWLMQVITSTGKIYYHSPGDGGKPYKLRSVPHESDPSILQLWFRSTQERIPNFF